VHAQSTIFNYQGRLDVNGNPANGLYDFQFTIFKVQTNGLVIAGPMTNTAVAVSNGLFNVALDFGNQPFLGVNRWLDIAVRTNSSADAFSLLSPRTRIASAPYAIAAANVIDGAVTAASLSPGPGPDGQVLKMSSGVLTWAPDLNSGGGVTSVDTGTGLLGGPITNSGTLSINPAVVPLLNGNQIFSGSNTFAGVSALMNSQNRFVGAFIGNGAGLTNITATSTNHNHFGQFWTGAAVNGLYVENTSTNDGSSALVGSAPASSGITFGVFGQSASPDGTGVQGLAYNSTNGNSTGVYGQSVSTNGTGVVGVGSASAGVPVGVYGEADAPLGIGVYGLGAATTGVPVGVYGTVSGTNGYGLYTPNNLYVGGSALMGALRVSGGTVFAGTNTFTKLLMVSGSSNSPALAFTNSPAAGLFSPGANILGLATTGTNRVYIAADGKVGIGRIPAANTLEVEGNASKTAAGQWLANSDARIKTGVQNLDHPLETIDRVRPVSFNYTDEYRAAHPSIEDKKYFNVIAQEFAKVFPDSVKESGEILDGKPILQVDVHPAAIYAIAAIQELHGLLKAKDDDLAKLKEQNTALEKRLQTLEKVVSGLAR